MAPKKNRINVFGKTFHVTPSGKVFPLGSKSNWFTKCMEKEASGMNTGDNLTPAQITENKETFATAVAKCKKLGAKPAPKKKAAT